MSYTRSGSESSIVTKGILYGWCMWLLATLFYALDYFQHTAPSVLLKPISENLGLSIIILGDIMSLYFPIYAIFQLPAGILLDRFGTKKVLSTACFIVSLGLLVTSISDGYLLIIVGRVLMAIGSSFAFVGALKVASDWLTPKLFPVAVGLTNTIGVLGGMFGQSILNWIILKFDWQISLLIISAVGFIIALLIVLFLADKNKTKIAGSLPEQKSIFKDLGILKNKQIWLIAIYSGIMVGTVVNAFSELYDVIFLEYNYNLSSEPSAIISSMIFVGIAAGGPSHGAISGIVKSRKLWMVMCNIITILLFGTIVMLPSFLPVWSLYFLYFALGFFVSSMLIAFAIAKDIFPKRINGISLAFVNMIIGVCGAVFQPLTGQIFYYLNGSMKKINDPNSFVIGFAILLIPLLVSFICCTLIKDESQ